MSMQKRAGSAFAGATRLVVLAVLPLVTAGCTVFPSDGPLADQVVAASANKGQTPQRVKQDTVFDVVDMDPNVADIVAAYHSPAFNKTFGLGGGGGNPIIGVGDVLQVTIFEAGPDGLFSTAEKKSTQVIVTVQPDGRAPVPYIGSIKFAGHTLESVRGTIAEALKTRAVEPDVIVTLATNASRTVAVNGVVGSPSLVPLGLSPERVTEVIAKAGGPRNPPYDTYVTLTRGGRTGKALLQTLIDQPKENIYLSPGDQLFLAFDPQTFTVMGATGQTSKIPLGAASISVVEATALAGGAKPERANPKGLFLFRYEYADVLRQVLGEQRFAQLAAKGLRANQQDMYPIVYRIDMTRPDFYLVGQTFPIRNKDVVYLAHHPSAEFSRFLATVVQFAVIGRYANSYL